MKKLKNSELNRISIEEFKNSSKTPIKVVLDNIRSAHNAVSYTHLTLPTSLAV